MIREEDSYSRGEHTSTSKDVNVPYTLSGLGNNFTLTWKSYTVKNYPAEPFEVVIVNGEVDRLVTSNWNSHRGVTLD